MASQLGRRSCLTLLRRRPQNKLPRRRFGDDADTPELQWKQMKQWTKYSFILGIPPTSLALYVAVNEDKHYPSEYKDYNNLRIQTRPFPFYDGKRSLFHNPLTNPVPGEGYVNKYADELRERGQM